MLLLEMDPQVQIMRVQPPGARLTTHNSAASSTVPPYRSVPHYRLASPVAETRVVVITSMNTKTPISSYYPLFFLDHCEEVQERGVKFRNEPSPSSNAERFDTVFTW